IRQRRVTDPAAACADGTRRPSSDGAPPRHLLPSGEGCKTCSMIILHAFGRVHPFVHGETRDLRVQWALEEMGLAYAVRGWDHTAGETTGPAFSAISPFNQIPVLEDDGLILSETGAILI